MPQLKLLPPFKPRLGLYLRPGRSDHKVFQQLLAEDRAVSGVVLEARHLSRHQHLREDLTDNGVMAVLDTQVMELCTPGGVTLTGLAGVPWAAVASVEANDLRGRAGRQVASAIAEIVAADGFGAVLAPTHFLDDATSTVFAADRAVTGYLREELDRRHLTETSIFYPLAIPAASLRDPGRRSLVIESLRSIDVDAVWLRLHPFGSTAGPVALRRYIELCWELQRIGLPLVAERSGTIGLALMAFGAVGGIESGITLGERFDAGTLLHPPDSRGKPFSPAPRVYLHDIGTFVSRASARQLFESRPMVASLGCRNASCCRSGIIDMIKDPRRHFVLRRTAEVNAVSSVPSEHRAAVFVTDRLRPAALLAVSAERILPQLKRPQRRMESTLRTLEAMRPGDPHPVSEPALGQRIRVQRPRPQSIE